MRHRRLTSLFAFTALAALARAAEAETARVLELTLSKFVDGEHDLLLVLYHREGGYYHGVARVPGRDSLPHRVDPTPAAPFGLFHADGGEIDYPKNEGVYAYRDERSDHHERHSHVHRGLRRRRGR